jgi:hypothetical protein
LLSRRDHAPHHYAPNPASLAGIGHTGRWPRPSCEPGSGRVRSRTGRR